jgi:cytochrome b561
MGMLALGLYMVRLPISLEKLQLYGLHKEYGLLLLTLVLIRITWRVINISPRLSGPSWEKFAAHAAHLALYGCMLAMPISGWLLTSAAGLPPSFFGLFVLPTLCAATPESLALFEAIHEWLAYGFIALIVLHASAALKHHFIDKDTVLRRMLPWSNTTTKV